MSWAFEPLIEKAKLYAQRGHSEDIHSSLFAFWMSLSLETLARAALSKIHPCLLADPTTEGNIHYAFGINPKTNPKSIAAKAVFARCSVMVPNFTDRMSTHCLLLADRRNKELHTGEAAFEGIDCGTWLPQTYEIFDILLQHCNRSLDDLLGTEHAATAKGMLKDQRESLLKEVKERISKAKSNFDALTGPAKSERVDKAKAAVSAWVAKGSLRQTENCPACGFLAAVSGEALSRGAAKIDEANATITREVRVLPNGLACPTCHLKLDSYQELLHAGVGKIFTSVEEEDPIQFFGIVPEDHVDINKLLEEHYYDEMNGYQNE